MIEKAPKKEMVIVLSTILSNIGTFIENNFITNAHLHSPRPTRHNYNGSNLD